MRTRRSSISSITLAAAIAIAAPLSLLSGQVVHTRTGTAAGSVAPAAPARIAGIAPPPPTIVIVTGDERFYTPTGNEQVIFANIPAFVLSDGRVFANFGGNIQEVARQCAGVLNTTAEGLFNTFGQPVVTQPTVVQPTAGATQPPPFTPNVPNQPTFSQQMLVQAIASGPVVVNPSSCWAANRVGQVFVTRP
jgi:hypothetical protein